jgi:hypothetical protein
MQLLSLLWLQSSHMNDGYDPRKSKVSDDATNFWIHSRVTGKLQKVPGIGVAAMKKLADHEDEYELITDTQLQSLQMNDGYDPRKSKVSDDAMNFWIHSGVTGKLQEVPGIGAAAMKKLADHEDEFERITNTHQLLGKYLQLYGPGKVSIVELNKKFFHFLKERGVTSHRNTIVLAVSKKVPPCFPGFHGEDDEEDVE